MDNVFNNPRLDFSSYSNISVRISDYLFVLPWLSNDILFSSYQLSNCLQKILSRFALNSGNHNFIDCSTFLFYLSSISSKIKISLFPIIIRSYLRVKSNIFLAINHLIFLIPLSSLEKRVQVIKLTFINLSKENWLNYILSIIFSMSRNSTTP